MAGRAFVGVVVAGHLYLAAQQVALGRTWLGGMYVAVGAVLALRMLPFGHSRRGLRLAWGGLGIALVLGAGAALDLSRNEGSPASYGITELDDVTALDRLGPYRLGMTPEDAHRAAGALGDSLGCRTVEPYLHCSPLASGRVTSEYSLMFRDADLVLIGWRSAGTVEDLRARYRGVGSLAVSGLSHPGPPPEITALWVGPDSTTTRMAFCSNFSGFATCDVTATLNEPGEVSTRMRLMERYLDSIARNAPAS